MDCKTFKNTKAVKKRTIVPNPKISFSVSEPPPLLLLKGSEEIYILDNNYCVPKNIYEINKNKDIDQNQKNMVVLDQISTFIDLPPISEIKPEVKTEVCETESTPPYSNLLDSEDNKSCLQQIVVNADKQCITDKFLHNPVPIDKKEKRSISTMSGCEKKICEDIEQLVKIEPSDFEQMLCDQNFEDCKIKREQLHQELDIKLEDLEPDKTSALFSEDQHKVYAVPKRLQSRNQVFKNQKLNWHGKFRFQCHSCDYQTKQRRNLQTHFLQHKRSEEVNMYKYDQAFYQNNLKLPLFRHQNSEEVRKFKCDYCDYRTVHKGTLNRHLLRHKSSEEVNMYKCGQCYHETFYKSSYKIHLLLHKNPKEVNIFICDQCDYETIYKTNLNRHILRHKNPEEVRKFKCDQCDYQAIHRGDLKKHLIRHSSTRLQKKPQEVNIFKCDKCDYRTIDKGTMKKHLRRHKRLERVKVYKCGQCYHQTFYKSHYKTHILLHKNPEEVNIFKCDQCDYESIYKSNLNRHLLRHKNP